MPKQQPHLDLVCIIPPLKFACVSCSCEKGTFGTIIMVSFIIKEACDDARYLHLKFKIIWQKF